MVLIYAILLPRYLKLTGSPINAILLGELTYAAMHIVEGWSVFDSPRDVALSLISCCSSMLDQECSKAC
jgi:hypothetical protein